MTFCEQFPRSFPHSFFGLLLISSSFKCLLEPTDTPNHDSLQVSQTTGTLTQQLEPSHIRIQQEPVSGSGISFNRIEHGVSLYNLLQKLQSSESFFPEHSFSVVLIPSVSSEHCLQSEDQHTS